jgi:hypothetical protein
MEFRNRPKSNYLLNAEWQELHTLTLHWQSDMVFFGDELRFMDLLIDRYFTLLVDKEHLAITKDVATKLTDVKAKYDLLAKQVAKHLHHIEDMMMNPFVTDSSTFRNEHVNLEDELAEFAKAFRKVKTDAFQMTERIIKSEKEKHLIGS